MWILVSLGVLLFSMVACVCIYTIRPGLERHVLPTPIPSSDVAPVLTHDLDHFDPKTSAEVFSDFCAMARFANQAKIVETVDRGAPVYECVNRGRFDTVKVEGMDFDSYAQMLVGLSLVKKKSEAVCVVPASNPWVTRLVSQHIFTSVGSWKDRWVCVYNPEFKHVCTSALVSWVLQDFLDIRDDPTDYYRISDAREAELRHFYKNDKTFRVRNVTGAIHGLVLKLLLPKIKLKYEGLAAEYSSETGTYDMALQFVEECVH